jgi:hypothetical protein
LARPERSPTHAFSATNVRAIVGKLAATSRRLPKR